MKRTKLLNSIWFLAFISGLTFTLQDIVILRENPFQPSIIHKNLSHLILGLFVGSQLIKRPLIIFKGFIIIFIFFSIYSAISTFWSIYPVWTLYRSIEYFIFIGLVAFTAFSLKDFKELENFVNFMWILIFLLIISVWFGIIISPKEALIPTKGLIPFMLTGAFPRLNANTVSHIGGIISIIGLNRILSKKQKKWVFLILLGCITMILSQGRSGILAFTISIVFLLFFYRKISLFFAIIVTAFLLFTYSEIDSILYKFLMRGQEPETILSLAGRTYKWEVAKTYILERPLLGYGAFAGSRFLVMPEIAGTLSSSTHNALIELLVDVGVIGTTLYSLGVLFVMINLLKFVFKYKNDEMHYFLIEISSILILLIVRSIFTTAVLITPYDFPFLTILVSTAWFDRKERIDSVKR